MTDATVTFDLIDALGEAYDASRAKIWVEFNTADGWITDENGRTRVGAGRVTLNGDGTGTIEGIPVPGPTTNPTSFQVQINYDVPPRAAQQRGVKRDRGSFGWFTITADAQLKDLVEEQYVPPTYLSTVTTALAGYVADGQAAAASAASSAADAEGFRDQASAIALGDAQAAIDAQKGASNGLASLDSGGKVPVAQLPNSIMQYQGVWDASTNTPALADSVGSIGDVYRVTVAGSQNLGSGSITFNVGDYAVLNSSLVWEKSDTTDAVASVAGKTGAVTLDKADVGLANVDNTSDATKNAAAATLTNKTIDGASNTVTLPASAITSGTLAIARGGTNSTATPTAGAVAYGDGTKIAYTAAGTTGQVLTSNGTGAPTWAASSGGSSTFKVQSVAQSYSASATPVDSDTLTYAIPSTGVYVVVLEGAWQTNVSASGLNARFAYSGTQTTASGYYRAGNTDLNYTPWSTPFTTQLLASSGQTATHNELAIRVVFTATATGTLTFQFAPETAGTGTATILPGTVMQVIKV